MEDIMIKYNNLKASLEQLQLNYNAIKKLNKEGNKEDNKESEYDQMLNDLKIYEERIHILEHNIIEKDNFIKEIQINSNKNNKE